MLFKAGVYFVGDPCYLFKESWLEFVSEVFNSDINDGRFEYKGFQVCVLSTAHGDGEYLDNFEREYSVDSGLIGVLPIDLVSVDNRVTSDSLQGNPHMHVVTFEYDFTCSSENGLLKFGNIEIDTAPQEEYDEDYFDSDFEDDDWEDEAVFDDDAEWINEENFHIHGS